MARLIDQFIGHQRQAKNLTDLLQAKRLPHALLFVGPVAVGKSILALALAQILVCESELKPCGLCGSCVRMTKKQSESLIWVQPDPEYAKPSIKVEDIRQLLEKLSYASMGKARIVIIEDAHLMNEQASNAILKTLEEPSEGLYFFLIATEASRLLPTIQSRSQVFRFTGLRESEIRQIKPELPDWAYKSSRGQIERLLSITSKQGLADRQEALDLLEQFCFDEEFLLHDHWRKNFKDDRDWALYNLRCWLQIVRDVLVLKADQPHFILNTDQIIFLKKLYSVSTQKLNWFSQALILALRDISGFQDASLVLDTLKVQYARLD